VDERQLALSSAESTVEAQVHDGALVLDEPVGDSVAAPVAGAPGPVALERRNLFAEAERIPGWAASPGTRRQYASIFRAFGDWLAGELGRPPVVGDVDADVIAAYGRHLAVAGGRGGEPASLATQRVYVSMVRALARGLGRDDAAAKVRVPRHEPGPPEALTDTDYANLLRVPDRRWLRAAELRGLRARDLRRPRFNARHHALYVRGKGGRDREVPVPAATRQALEAWLRVHPLARGVALRDDDALFVRVGWHAHERPSPPLAHRGLPDCARPGGGRRRARSARAPARAADVLGHPRPGERHRDRRRQGTSRPQRHP